MTIDEAVLVLGGTLGLARNVAMLSEARRASPLAGARAGIRAAYLASRQVWRAILRFAGFLAVPMLDLDVVGMFDAV